MCYTVALDRFQLTSSNVMSRLVSSIDRTRVNLQHNVSSSFEGLELHLIQLAGSSQDSSCEEVINCLSTHSKCRELVLVEMVLL